jgi:hypothetical protein
MDKRFNGHTWCRTITSNIHNNQSLTFRKSLHVGQLVCNNQNCNFLSKSSKRNETEWLGQTNTPFNQGHSPLLDSTLVCKVSKVPRTCVNFCNACIYYVLSKSDITRACIYLGMHNHPIFDGIYRGTFDTIFGLIAQEVFKTPIAKNFAIKLAASKEFLNKYLIHSGSGPKKMLQGKTPKDIMDKFEILSSSNLRNTISLFRSDGKGGAYDSIMAIKRSPQLNTSMECLSEIKMG